MQHWVRRHGRPGPPPHDQDALEAEVDRLRDEVRRLTMEREVLKVPDKTVAGALNPGS